VKKIRYLIEYAALCPALLLIDILPLRVVEGLASRVADLLFLCAGARRRVAIENILHAGIAMNASQALKIARESFRHFAVLVVESLKSGRYFSEENWEEKLDVTIHPDTEALLRKPGQGVIVVSGHIGNWEIAAQLLSHIKPFVGIARDMNNPYVNRLVKKRKPRNRFRTTPKHDTDMGRLLRTLKHGECLAILIDQHARTGGMMIDFMGRPADTHTSAAMLHLVTKTPICFASCVRTGPMQFVLNVMAPLIHVRTGDRRHDVEAILNELTKDLEAVIRKHPEQYLWAHRRWKNAPRKTAEHGLE